MYDCHLILVQNFLKPFGFSKKGEVKSGDKDRSKTGTEKFVD